MKLDEQGHLVWMTYGPDKFRGPYEIDFGSPAGAVFGSKASSKPGSQAQLKAFYVSQAVWLTLKSMRKDIFEDRDEAGRIVHTVARIANREIGKDEFEASKYNESVKIKSYNALAKTGAPRDTNSWYGQGKENPRRRRAR